MRINVTARSQASAGALYALLRDGATWPTWSPLESFELERPGNSGGESVNAIRVFRTGRTTSRERIVELIEGQRLGYALLSGLPLKDYRATVDLIPDGDGTVIHWRSRFKAKVPGTGWLYKLALTRFIRRCATGLAAAPASTSSRPA